jgi:putative FmdB family regulatory protein
MPIYEYRCRACSKDFEKYVSGPRASVACPACASSDIQRKLSVFGLRAGDPGPVASSMPLGGGGCCGGGCSCH